MASSTFCGAARCEWGHCDECMQTARCVSLLTDLSADELKDLGGFECQGICGGS